jgi:uncharacterized protein YeaO (DUF488 family)
MTTLAVKRAYEAPDDGDGTRILVDRLWPRGMTKEKARIDLWLKDIAPSDALRKRFHGSRMIGRRFVQSMPKNFPGWLRRRPCGRFLAACGTVL